MDIKSRAKYWIRQFPYIFPSKIIYSCQDWIQSQKQRKGDYFSQRGSWYKIIFPAGFLHHPLPKTLGQPNEKAFYYNRDYPTGQATLFYLQNCYVLGHKGLVLTAGHQVFQEFSHHFNIASLKKFFWRNPFYTFSTKARHISGMGAVLVSPESHNYYHWLNDVLPRIKLYEQVFDKIDHFCVASNVPPKFLEILTDFGIPKEKLLLVNEKEKLHFDHLYVASLPGSEGRSPRWAVDYIREKLIKPANPVKPLNKLYFRRGQVANRNILNENAVVSALKDDGFEIVDPSALSIKEQANLVRQAKLVVSAHGAALSNLLFSPDNLSVIELFSADYFRTDCYYTLSSIRNLNYWYIIGEKPAGAAWGDITVPIDLLMKTIEHAGTN